MKKLCTVVLFFAGIIPFLGFGVVNYYPSLEEASYFSTTFGIGASLFSGAALGLAIYSFVLQQHQNDQFEQVTLTALEGQMEAISLLKQSIDDQSSSIKINALQQLITVEESRISDLKDWGKSRGDESKYEAGIKAANKRIKSHRDSINSLACSLSQF